MSASSMAIIGSNCWCGTGNSSSSCTTIHCCHFCGFTVDTGEMANVAVAVAVAVKLLAIAAAACITQSGRDPNHRLPPQFVQVQANMCWSGVLVGGSGGA
ncbi:unnamed protein product [Ceratitis capitata]|uniref:(Mediterranean fruit fly) hypothetical protein n=1 Tax=Ceratitis capitata TaxID=7213 RepID=A0A811UCH7_CERCA|nr:unnamed protein product [Ceratitis capitata]